MNSRRYDLTDAPTSSAVSDALDESVDHRRVNGHLANLGVLDGPRLVSSAPHGIIGRARVGVVVDAPPGTPIRPPGLAPFLTQLEPGDVLVIAWHAVAIASCCGGMAAKFARDQGCVALVTDGWVRDIDEIEALGLPVWSRGVTPRTGKGRIQFMPSESPVMIGGVLVSDGDTVVADATGVCVVAADSAESVLVRARELDRLDNIVDGVLPIQKP